MNIVAAIAAFAGKETDMSQCPQALMQDMMTCKERVFSHCLADEGAT